MYLTEIQESPQHNRVLCITIQKNLQRPEEDADFNFNVSMLEINGLMTGSAALIITVHGFIIWLTLQYNFCLGVEIPVCTY